MTDSLDKIFNQIQHQLNPKFESPFQAIQKALESQNRLQFNLSSQGYLTDIAKSISRQLNPLSLSPLNLSNNIRTLNLADQYLKSHNSFSGLNFSIAEIAKSNQFLSERITGYATSQLILSNNLNQIVNSIDYYTHLSKFNTLDIALRSISKTYLKTIVSENNWEEIAVAEEANETISNVADDLLNSKNSLTVNDLDNLRQSILTELSGLLGRTKTDKARQFIFELIAIISFVLIFYNPFVIPTDKSNTEVINESKREIEKLNKEMSVKIEYELNKLNKTRTAITNVNLRYSDKLNSKIIGLVKKGQQVTVIEIRHKHLLISYIDKDNQEPKSGFVTKKYFETDK